MAKYVDNSDFKISGKDFDYMLNELNVSLSSIKEIEDFVKENGLHFFNDKRKIEINYRTARKNLGREEFLSGVSRATFHDITIRTNEKTNYSVLFQWGNEYL